MVHTAWPDIDKIQGQYTYYIDYILNLILNMISMIFWSKINSTHVKHVFKLLNSRLATYFIIVNNEISDLFSKFNFGKAVKWYNMSGLTTFFLFMLILKIATLSWLSKNQIRMRVPLLVMFITTSSLVRAWSKMNMNHLVWTILYGDS